ncbi:hypothetical protein A0H81_14395 [Grifola frondosa]|uniref:DUF6699 domain-containing protein n=1 Tax=Grifola frondosa TaxID=5627 RepID=A0A1C7LS46_GRIFR|nr:hypothetical protein A0H81_14395 [Grifola frondosa]
MLPSSLHPSPAFAPLHNDQFLTQHPFSLLIMPGKHVRFLDDGVPATPSPTFSGSSLVSSPGPRTPLLATNAYLSPQKSRPYSPSSFGSSPYVSGQVRLHPALAAIPTGKPITWDMTLPPTAASPTLTNAHLAEPATHPALPSITIVCDRLPWAINVTPTTSAKWATNFVTVGDILHVLHRTLRLPATTAEIGCLPVDLRERVYAAYRERYVQIADPKQRAEEKLKSVKRVDFLVNATRFNGLSLVTGGPMLRGKGIGEVWSLQCSTS